MASSQLLALLCVIAAAVVQVHGMEVWPVDGYTQEDLHEAVQDHLGPAISLLDVTTIEEAEEVGDRKFSDEQREVGELHVRKFVQENLSYNDVETLNARGTQGILGVPQRSRDHGVGEVGEDKAKSNAQRSLLRAHPVVGRSRAGAEQGEGANPVEKVFTSEDKKADQRAKEKDDEEKKADKPKSDKPKADEVPRATTPKEDRAKKIEIEEKNAEKKKQKKEQKTKEEKIEIDHESELKKRSAQMHSQMRSMGINERLTKNKLQKITVAKKKKKNIIVNTQADKDTAKLPRDALPPVQVHGHEGRVDPAEPRRTFLMNPADTPRGFQYCTDRHTITFTSVEAPDIPASLCGKCEGGFTLLPMTNLGFKMLGICYSIKGISKRGHTGCDGTNCKLRPLPLWDRVKSLPRMTYNDRSCRYFMTIKGWRKKQNYIAKENGLPKAAAEKWRRVSQTSENKRAHATQCAVTTRTSDASLGEYKDPRAAATIKARKYSGSGGKWFATSLTRDGPDDVKMPTESHFQCVEPGTEECVIAEGWKYDYQELKVAKYSGCYTHLQSRPTLTCDKATQILACNQVRVFSTFSWLEEKTETGGYKIVDKLVRKGDYTIYATERASWWNKGAQARSMYVVDEAPFFCTHHSPRLCRKHWENRASYLAIAALELKGKKPCQTAECGGASWTAFKGCQRMMSEAALSLQ